MPEALLQTKFYIPPLRPDLVSRPRLLERLNQGLALGHQLTLISAPAGFGKTTLLAEWLSTLDWPVAWLSLDPADDDPGRFLAYLIAALQQLDAQLGREAGDMLRAGQLPPAAAAAVSLLNDLLALPGPGLLVLDDLQLIQDPYIITLLEQLVVNLPPALHLVLSSREDPPLPLARLRAGNRLAEIRARELRFSLDDAGRFLNDALALSLSGEDVATLERKTEGWAAGLQLAALSIRDRSDPSALIAGLSGSHRLIVSYLTEQVLDHQPADIRRFLLQTAILDRLTGDLCDAVTGRSDGRAMLERLVKANLFLVPLDDQGHWYRYHHLFADLLRDRQHALEDEELAPRHRRASCWHESQGLFSPAIDHALAAEDYAWAVELLERHALDFIMQGYARTADGWLQAIPAEWRARSLRTNLALAWAHLLRGDYRPAAIYLAQSQAAVEEAGPDLRAGWLVMQSLMLFMQGQWADSRDTAAQALAIAPEDDGRVRSLAHYALASADRLQGNFDRAAAAYQAAVTEGRTAGNLVAELMSLLGLAQLDFEQGRLQAAFDALSPVIGRLEQAAALPPISAVLYGVLGDVYFHWYRLDEAREHYRRSLQLSALGGYNNGLIFNNLSLSRLALLQGDLDGAARLLQEAVDQMPAELPDYVRQEMAARQVALSLAGDRPGPAAAALQDQGFSFQDGFSYPDPAGYESLTYSQGLLYCAGLRYLTHQARDGRDLAALPAGLDLAGRLIVAAVRDRQHLLALEMHLLRAQIWPLLGKESDGRADLIAALDLGRPEGYVAVFIEQGRPLAEALAGLIGQDRLAAGQAAYARRILDLFTSAATPSSEGVDALAELLTGRELEVLRLMAEGLKYREIAGRLYISINTVRYHVKALYGKLNVNNRTQALETARRLGLL